MVDLPANGLQLRSLVTEDGKLILSLEDAPVTAPGPDQILIHVEATPINPTDVALLTAVANMADAVQGGTSERPVISAQLPSGLMRAMRGRIGQSLPVGSEGAGIVIAAGSRPAAQALLGKRVTCLAGEMFGEYRTLDVSMCMALPDGISAEEGAASYINPLTSLSFVETMRSEGHAALVHTAAASNLGQMLNRICLADDILVVNIVRRAEQAEILHEAGAKYVINSTAADFMVQLIDAIAETGATLGFDAVGGGPLAGQILTAMSVAASRSSDGYARYGSNQQTQVYIYGRLDLSPTCVPAGVGFAWSLGGYLLMPFLEKAGEEVRERLQKRVLAELATTFASHYTKSISLREALDLETLRAYAALATGEKYLVTPIADAADQQFSIA